MRINEPESDVQLVCRECGASFIFTTEEQAAYARRKLENQPTRCRACRTERRGAGRPAPGEREETVIACSACGLVTTVPFRPDDDSPVYGRDCYPAFSGQ